jgi:hypothetical protein
VRSVLPGAPKTEDYVFMGVAAVIISGLAVLVSVIGVIFLENRERKRSRIADLERLSSQQGRPTTDLVSRAPSLDRAYNFRVTNVGRSSMMHIRTKLVDRLGKACSAPLPDDVPGTLQTSQSAEFVLKVTEPVNRNPLFLHYAWFDETGFRERLSAVTVPTK